ncbi:hypothetical protein Bca52824_051359 [Brassica carinata]|uniref:Uncharacterized protein n=1 Tax=Brassica carinata TaxID=52824 RepID=A0A8X7UIU7_BRACI|nr:hypothetical protein Bca52824_051359 [Brassica carinata]
MNHELNDKKRLATSGAGFARAFTVQFGSCKFIPLISEYLALECEGKDKYKCGSNVFWKW